MAGNHLWKHMFFFAVLSARWAAFPVETLAQPRSQPESPLTGAIAEVLRSPFHGGRELPSPRLPLLPVAPPTDLPGHVGLISPAPWLPGGQVPVADNAPSRGKVFLLSALASAAGVYGTLLWYHSCGYFGGVDRSGFGGGGQGPGDHRFACPENDGIVATTGLLGTVAMTAGAGKLAGSRFGRSLSGSALGVAGGWLAVASTIYLAIGADIDIPWWVGAGLFSVAQGGVVALISN